MNKRLLSLIAAALLASTTQPALADRDHHRSYRYGGHEYHHHRHWVGPAITLGIAGAAIGATIYQQAPSPPPPAFIYGAPPPSPRIWYFCPTVGQYYPYIQYCPDGWQAMPAR